MMYLLFVIVALTWRLAIRKLVEESLSQCIDGHGSGAFEYAIKSMNDIGVDVYTQLAYTPKVALALGVQ